MITYYYVGWVPGILINKASPDDRLSCHTPRHVWGRGRGSVATVLRIIPY